MFYSFQAKTLLYVIQTTEGRKNLVYIHFTLSRFFANALNDKCFRLFSSPKLVQNPTKVCKEPSQVSPVYKWLIHSVPVWNLGLSPSFTKFHTDCRMWNLVKPLWRLKFHTGALSISELHACETCEGTFHTIKKSPLWRGGVRGMFHPHGIRLRKK